jgi:hypothetical protein
MAEGKILAADSGKNRQHISVISNDDLKYSCFFERLAAH